MNGCEEQLMLTCVRRTRARRIYRICSVPLQHGQLDPPDPGAVQVVHFGPLRMVTGLLRRGAGVYVWGGGERTDTLAEHGGAMFQAAAAGDMVVAQELPAGWSWSINGAWYTISK